MSEFDELQFERHLASNPVLALPEFWYWVRKLQARFFAGDYATAVDASLKAQQLLWTSPSQFETAEFRFYGALSHAASWDSASPDQRQQHFEALTAHHRQLEIWAEHCPENFENRAALVGAEIARIEGRDARRRCTFTNRPSARRTQTALSTMRRSPTRSPRVSTRHVVSRRSRMPILREARYCYLRWGADGKVRQLDELYPHLREEEPTARSDEHDRGTGRTPGSRYRDQSLASSVGRDRSGETDRHAHAHGD